MIDKNSLQITNVPDMFMARRRALAGRGGRNHHIGRFSKMSEKVPILAVLGLDVDGKPHASRFEERDAAFVVRAAELMRFHVIRVPADNAELHGIAVKLPLGKIFASGRSFVPFVGRAAFDKLAVLVEGGVTIEARRPAAQVGPVHPLADMFTTDAVNTADALWSKIEVGNIVLAAADPELYGLSWWQGVVIGVEGDDLTIRWMDDPALEPFHASRRHVALLHPRAD
jgi:hypothetical protein